VRTRAVAVRVFVTCWLVYTAYFTPYIVREHFPAITLAESGAFNVERFLGWTEDIFAGPRGGAYINNNPGASIAGAVPLMLAKPLLDAAKRRDRGRPPGMPPTGPPDMVTLIVAHRQEMYFMLVALVTVAGLMAPVSAATAALLSSRLMQAGVSAGTAALIALLYALGTPVFFRNAYLNHNMLVASAALTAFLLLWDSRKTDSLPAAQSAEFPLRSTPPEAAFALLWDREFRRLGATRAFACGLLCGYAVLCDFSGLIVVGGVGLYVLLRSRDGAPRVRLAPVLSFAAGVAPMVAGLVAYQWFAFGSSLHPSQHYMAPTAPTAAGYRGFDWPSLSLIRANFFDTRFGLFAYSPALLLSLGAPFARNVRFRIPRRESVVLVVYTLGFVLFSAANQYSWLQPSTGFRYLAPVVFVPLLFTVQTLQALPRGLRTAVAICMFAQSWLLAATHERNITVAFSRLLDTQSIVLPWMQRGAQYGLFEADRFWPLMLNVILAAAIGSIWWKIIRLPAKGGRP